MRICPEIHRISASSRARMANVESASRNRMDPEPSRFSKSAAGAFPSQSGSGLMVTSARDVWILLRGSLVDRWTRRRASELLCSAASGRSAVCASGKEWGQSFGIVSLDNNLYIVTRLAPRFGFDDPGRLTQLRNLACSGSDFGQTADGPWELRAALGAG